MVVNTQKLHEFKIVQFPFPGGFQRCLLSTTLHLSATLMNIKYYTLVIHSVLVKRYTILFKYKLSFVCF